jgi:pimeloyl-ACP methyl ester carboxylesterase
MKRLLRIARNFAVVYLAIVLLFAGCQNQLLYHPSRGTEPALLGEAQAAGLAPWRDATGALVGWRTQRPSAKRRLVVFHGNAGFALHRTYYVAGFEPLDCEVYLFEYPGYGAREGALGRDSFLAAGRSAIDSLLASDNRPIYLLGESIGSGTACCLIAAYPNQIAGLILIIPFARLVEVAKTHFPYLPVGLILHDKYDNVASLAHYRGPVAIALAEHDEIIPPEQARKLHDLYAGPKHLIAFPGASHNTFPTHVHAPWWREVTDFMDSNISAVHRHQTKSE